MSSARRQSPRTVTSSRDLRLYSLRFLAVDRLEVAVMQFAREHELARTHSPQLHFQLYRIAGVAIQCQNSRRAAGCVVQNAGQKEGHIREWVFVEYVPVLTRVRSTLPRVIRELVQRDGKSSAAKPDRRSRS